MYQESRHLIIGTAGHVDHGKTALVGTLTGIETDRLKEERERGLSIELGFAYFDLPDNSRAGDRRCTGTREIYPKYAFRCLRNGCRPICR